MIITFILPAAIGTVQYISEVMTCLITAVQGTVEYIGEGIMHA